jgi:hypothetical protein
VLISLILLLSLLPRIIVAAPEGVAVCFSNDHVAVACHEEGSTGDCGGDEPNPSHDGNTGEPVDGACLDVLANSIETTLNGPKPSIDLALVLDTVAEIIVFESVLLLCVGASPFDTVVCVPRQFCARTFACLMSPRC